MTDTQALTTCLKICADDPMWADHAEVSKVLLRRTITALTDAEAKLAKAREMLDWYARTCCEGFGECVGDLCGKLSADECGGCPARACLAELGEG
jgi:hypothetical protein